jgi:imidazolonepropionase-like amidohydrolase
MTGSGATAFGTLPGISLHTELEMLSHMGLSNRQVIAAATNNFSLLWDWRHIGKIAPGREADLLVLSANPLDSLQALKQIDILMVDGHVVDRDVLLIKPH